MDQELREALTRIEEKVDATYRSGERMRKYFLWTLILTLVFFILPLLALVFVIPWFLDAVTGGLL